MKYSLTPEHEAQLKPWADKWIANVMSTKPMDDHDREQMRIAIKGLYESAGLTPPPNERIVFVPSPFVAHFAGGFASAIWWNRKQPPASDNATDNNTHNVIRAATVESADRDIRVATDSTTYGTINHEILGRVVIDTYTFDAIDDASIAATHDATHPATSEFTRKSNYESTNADTYIGTHKATYDAAYESIFVPTYNATYSATIDATTDAIYFASIDVATHRATFGATYDATYDAIDDASRNVPNVAYRANDDAAYVVNIIEDATYSATIDAINEATDDTPYEAVYESTHDTIYASTHTTYDIVDTITDATYDAGHVAMEITTSKDKWYSSIKGFVDAGIQLGVGELGFKCAKDAWRMMQGGNFWSAWESYLSFFRHVAKLDIDYSKYQHWESAAIHGSCRVMHPDFCIVSDRPEILTVDEQHRPHGENGPFCKWRDGMELYAWHGTRVPQWVIENPELITPERILAEENAEVRRVMQERYGFQRFFLEMKSAGKVQQIDCKDDISGLPVTLYAYNDNEVVQHFVHVYNGTIESDGTRHEFTINCKNIDNDAFESVMGTYPDIMALVKDHPNRMDMLRNAIRT